MVLACCFIDGQLSNSNCLIGKTSQPQDTGEADEGTDPLAITEVDPAHLASRSRNTPYAGRTFSGAVRHTVLRGEPVVIDATAQR